MDASIVVFTLRKDMKPVEKVKFCQALYGKDVSTWKGKYRYYIPGILDGIPHRRISKGVLVIRTSDLPAIKGYFSGKTDDFYVRSIVPEGEDIDALRTQKQSGNQK